MYSSPRSVIDWLSQSASSDSKLGHNTTGTCPLNRGKRPISPAPSETMDPAPGAKRARVQPRFGPDSPPSGAPLVSPEDAVDEVTPRSRNPAPAPAPLDAQSSSNASSSAHTSDSFDSAATPSKRRRKSRGIAMASSGAPDVVFLDGTEPAALRSLVRHYALVRREKHFVWPELLEQVRTHPLHDTTFNDLTSRTWYYNPQEPADGIEPLGTCPSAQQLHDILVSAWECEQNFEPESHWNCAVHWPLLRLALCDVWGRLRASNCTAATINSQSSAKGLVLGKDTKKVDFCIVLCHAHPKITDIITDLGESINHTNHDAFTKTPIAISIETKGRAADQEEAILQLATWLSAHFSRLRVLFMRQHQSPAASGEDDWDAAVAELCFLPAIMVFQHEWYLVAATLERERQGGQGGQGQRLKMWRKVLLGSTQNVEGICEVVYGVRRLAVWAEDTYWPWFRRYALGDMDV